MSMHVQACKDKASYTLVKIVTLQNTTDFDDSITDMNLIDQLSTLIADENNRSCDASITNSTELYRSVMAHTHIARMNAIYSKHVCYI